jgi:hypothetical protein
MIASVLNEGREGNMDCVVKHCSEDINKLSSFVLVAKKDADMVRA